MHVLTALALAFAAPQDPAAPPQDPAPAPPSLEERAQELVGEVHRLRGLETHDPVPVGAYTREELGEFILREATREIEMDKFRDGEKVLKFLGLLPADMNLWDTMLELYGSQIAGFYDPESKELKLIRSEGNAAMTREEEVYMVHELTHAAQDQNFDLLTYPSGIDDDDDINYALTSLTEGDASVSMWLWYGGEEMIRRSRMLAAAMGGQTLPYPRYLTRTLMFPYSDGLVFAAEAYQGYEHDWTRYNRMFGDYPLSTEQILHPEKFLRERDDPVYLRFGDLRGALPGGADAWRALKAENTLGELVIGLWFQELGVRGRDAARQARDWDGDRIVVYERASDQHLTSSWISTWDSEEASTRFFEQAVHCLDTKYAQPARETVGNPVRISTDRGGVFAQRRGLDVLILEGVPEGGEGLADAAWGSIWRADLVGLSRTPPRYRCEAHPENDSYTPRLCPECSQPEAALPRQVRAVEETY